MKALAILSVILLTGCVQIYDPEDNNLRTVPVTNNPHIVPDHGSGIPGFSR